VPALLLALLAGPLGLRTQGPLRELFLDITGADARPIDKPEFDFRWSFANTWNEPMTLQRGPVQASQVLDEQADTLTARFKAPWPGGIPAWTALEWKLTEHWGGWSDVPIEGWHSLVGAFNYQRSLYPRNTVRLLYADDHGTAFDIRSPTLAVGDLTARTQITLIDAAVAVAARLDLKFPLGSLSSAGGSGGLDGGVGLLATWPMSSWSTLHGLVAVSAFSNLVVPTAMQPKRWHFTGELSLELEFLGTTFLVEDRVLSPLLASGWDRTGAGATDQDAILSSGLFADFRTHNQISFGVRRGRVSFWLSEDFTPGRNSVSAMQWMWVSNAPDLVMGVAFTQPL